MKLRRGTLKSKYFRLCRTKIEYTIYDFGTTTHKGRRKANKNDICCYLGSMLQRVTYINEDVSHKITVEVNEVVSSIWRLMCQKGYQRRHVLKED